MSEYCIISDGSWVISAMRSAAKENITVVPFYVII